MGAFSLSLSQALSQAESENLRVAPVKRETGESAEVRSGQLGMTGAGVEPGSELHCGGKGPWHPATATGAWLAGRTRNAPLLIAQS